MTELHSPGADPVPNTWQAIAAHARGQPDAVAIVHRGINLTWRVLAAHILAVMDDLQEHGLQAGQTLGIEVDDRYLHLLIILAAEVLGVTTMSLNATDIGPPADLGRLCDRIVATRAPAAYSDKAWLLTPDWPVRIMTRDMNPLALERLEHDAAPDAVVRLMTTSGTTGRPKVMGMSQALLNAHIRVLLHPIPPEVAAHPRFLCLYRFTMRGAHTRCMLTLRCGGTIYFTGLDVLWDNVLTRTGNFLLMLSGDLERFVRAAPSGGGPFDLVIDVIGGAVPDPLRETILNKITRRLTTTYSTSETHYVSLVGHGGVGRLLPGVQVTIVDERGEPVAPGETGIIRARTTTMISGYIDAQGRDRAAFIDGWYNTNDLGYQPDADTLVVIGRADDMLNIGGIKFAPAPIEARLRTVGGVQDVLVTDLPDDRMTASMLVAIETAPGADGADVARRVEPLLQGYTRSLNLLVVQALPRTESGKIPRDAVRDLYRRSRTAG